MRKGGGGGKGPSDWISQFMLLRYSAFLRSTSTRHMSSSSPAPVKEQPWYAALPVPKATPVQLQAEELKKLMDQQPTTESNVTHLVVDVRRTDFEVSSVSALLLPAAGGSPPSACSRRTIRQLMQLPSLQDAFIQGAVNLPAQSFYQTLPSLIPLLTRQVLKLIAPSLSFAS